PAPSAPAPAPYAPAPSPYAAPRPAAPSPQPAPWQAAPSGYAAAPDETQGARTLGILFLGILLVLACVLPMMMPAMGKVEVMFTNFTLLGEEQVRFVGKLLLLLPGIAGIAAIVLAFAVRNVVRSIILLGLGIAAFVLPLFDETAGRLPGIVAFTGPGSGIGLVCMFAGAAVLYAGCRSRCFRPWSLAAAIVGAIGGAIYVASLVLPQTAGADIEIVRQFKMLERQTMVEGIVQLVVTVLALLACVLCFINIPLAPKGRKLGVAAFWLLLVSMLLCYYGMILVPGLQGGDIPGELILPLIVVTLKTGSFILGTVLLVGVGLADLIVNLSRGGAPAAAAGGPPLYSTPGASPYGAPAPYAPPSPYAAPSPYGGAPAAPPQDDTSARLQRLNDAYARGLISPAEYERKKNEILSRM
ncbi:MAG: SHOCT domain-containing protein, partial [Planctomycetes bacterium]|nr:SHOCT domain-containing protein [Planctomycetota bacterium]